MVLSWALGVGLFGLRIAAGRIGLLRARLRGRALESGPARALLDVLGARRVRLVETEAALAPATWGAFRPVVALPAGFEAWPRDRLVAVLTHELAHVRRCDAMRRLGADLCRALFWFHPGVWFARRRMHAESERACDDAVLAAGTEGVPYAETLLGLARGVRARAAMAMADARDLESRLRAILDPATPRSSSRPLLASGPALALLATATMAGLDPWGNRLHAQSRGDAAQPPALDDFPDERVPSTREQEEAALRRSFRPRDAREERAFARLREAAGHEKQHAMDLVRERALWALSVAQVDRVIDPLVAALADSDWRVRAYAAWSLALVGAPEAREALTACLEDPVWRVRSEAACALAALGDARSLAPMLRRLDDPAWQVRMPVVEYLGRIGTPEARATARRRLADPHVAVRTAAESALGSSPTR
jgi:HEAT repeat protein